MKMKCILFSMAVCLTPPALGQPVELSDEGALALVLCTMSFSETFPAICDEIDRQDLQGPVLDGRSGEKAKESCGEYFPNPSTPQYVACLSRAVAIGELIAKRQADQDALDME